MFFSNDGLALLCFGAGMAATKIKRDRPEDVRLEGSPLKVNQPAPDFALPTDGGWTVDLKKFKGNQVVLFFYPRDLSPGCIQEACDFRDQWMTFWRKGAVILGISADELETHKRFKALYGLPYPLLSDTHKLVLSKYGAWQAMMSDGRMHPGILRTTVLVNSDGKVKKIWSPVVVKGHVREVAASL